MIVRLRIPLLFSLLILLYILFSYSFLGGWFYSSLGSILIIFLGYLIWGKDFLKQIGLQLNLQAITKSIILAVIIASCALLIMKYIGNRGNIRIDYDNWRGYYHVMFYVLNEEIVIGAILLFTVVYKWKIRPVVASLCIAILFSLIHYIFYKWIFADRGILGISTLITLFLVGFVRNSLIILNGHIGYSWALHFGWIAIMFGSIHTYLKTNMYVAESERFNLYLGSAEMLIISVIMAGFTLAYWIIKYTPQQVRIQN
ncbi:MAG: hypothetical protein ABFS38_14300 [Bacteroidota bacterium]